MRSLLPSSRSAARAYASIMYAVAAFHMLLVFGAPWGEFTQGGSDVGALGIAGRVAAAVSMGIALLLASVVLAWHGQGLLRGLKPRWLRLLGPATVLYSILAVVLNLVTPSAHERAVWAPVAVAALLLVLRARPSSRDGAQPIQ